MVGGSNAIKTGFGIVKPYGNRLDDARALNIPVRIGYVKKFEDACTDNVSAQTAKRKEPEVSDCLLDLLGGSLLKELGLANPQLLLRHGEGE